MPKCNDFDSRIKITPYDDGWMYGYNDYPPNGYCPHDEGTEEYNEWYLGYEQGCRDG